MNLHGHYINGVGKASKVFNTKEHINDMYKMFNCRMFGTFNFLVEKGDLGLFDNFQPTIKEENNGNWVSFYLGNLKKGKDNFPVWIIKWGPKKKKDGNYLELISKELIPNNFKEGQLELELYRPWDRQEINDWLTTQKYWFQKFLWSPEISNGRKCSDSSLVLDTFKNKIEWANKSVLDIGGQAGFFSFELSKMGAFVSLFEPNKEALETAITIGKCIECQDVSYYNSDPGGNFDVILYLSVHHQKDISYAGLRKELEVLKSRCKYLVLELIVPPMKGSMTAEQVNKIVGVEPLLTYQHNVRCVRSIYLIES